MKPMTVTDEMTEAALVKWFKSETTWHVGMAPWSVDQFRAEMKAALSAALSVPAAAVVGEPEGWKLVPIEPTPEMESKGADAFFSPQPQSIEDENARAASVYRRMLSAAPSAPEGYVRGHLHLIRCFADDMTERNWEDKRLYIKQQVDFIVSALGGSHE